ncbi:MAG: DUF2804 domain-containing protein [Candidatus Saccharibacteria bacterium]
MADNQLREPELTTPVKLCDEKGCLASSCRGWARQPFVECNLPARWPRKKRWNYWFICHPECIFSAAIVDIDYLGQAFMYFLDLNTKLYIEKTVQLPLSYGLKMQNTVLDNVEYKGSRLQITFARQDDDTHLQVKGQGVEADITIHRPPGHETLNAVIPWSDRVFHFTSKQVCLPSEGYIRAERKQYDLNPDFCFASLDYARGIWPYRIGWNWATASGIAAGGQVAGLNLGSKWTDGTGMTENAIVVDGRLQKISDNVLFEYDLKNIMKPWHIKTVSSDRINLLFEPVYSRVNRTNAIVLGTELYQVVGYYSGQLLTDEQETITLDRVLGSAEEHNCKW